MKFKTDDIYALIGTILVHLVLLLILYFSILRFMVPNEDSSGVIANFGYEFTAVGINEPPYPASTRQTESVPQPKPVPKTEKSLITQDEEESVSIPDKKKIREQEQASERARAEEAERRRREEERKRREKEERRIAEIDNQVNRSMAMSREQGTHQGEATTGSGNQGNPFGNASSGSNEGKGVGWSFEGDGVSLAGNGMPSMPEYTERDEGSIVIEVVISPTGKVISATVGKGTNISNATMRKKAIAAAYENKYVIHDKGKIDNSYAKIKFNYKFR